MRSPEILIQEMFKGCLSSRSWALQFSFWKKSHLRDQNFVREMKAGISGKGQFCWHTQCMVSQRDIFAVIQVQSFSSTHNFVSQFDHPKPLKLYQIFLVEQETGVSWNLVGCQDRKQDASLVVFALQKTLCGLLLITILCTTDIFHPRICKY